MQRGVVLQSLLVGFGLLMTLGAGTCVPHITAFNPVPLRVCTFPATIKADWSAIGDTATLTVGAGIPQGVPLVATGVSIGVGAPTQVQLLARAPYGIDVQSRRIEQQTADFSATIGGPAQCSTDGRTLEASALLPRDLPPGMRFDSLRGISPPGRAIGMIGGMDVVIHLVTPALAGECGAASAPSGSPLPFRLEALVSYSCPGGAAAAASTPFGPGGPTGAAACGTAGRQCCPVAGEAHGSCQVNGLACQIGSEVCVDPASPGPVQPAPRCNGAPFTPATRGYEGAIVDSNGCGVPWQFFADSVAEAEACATAIAPGSDIVRTRLTSYPFCRRTTRDEPRDPHKFRPGDDVQVWSDSAEHADSCAAHAFVSASAGTTAEAGLCPRR